MKLAVHLVSLYHIMTTMQFVLLSLAIVPIATCFNLRSYRAVGDECPLQSCMENKIDFDAAFERMFKVDRQPAGFRLTFGKDIFSFSCSVFDMFTSCVNGLDSQELDTCIPVDEQILAFRVISMVDDAVCSKDMRLDKLVPCMNDEKVQKMFFEDLLFTGFRFLDSLERTGALPCQDLKTTYLYAVGRLSNSCNNDGLVAILEMFSELATEVRDIIALGLTQTGLSLNQVCFDVIVNATVTAKDNLSNGNPKGIWGI